MLDYANTGILDFADMKRVAPRDKGRPSHDSHPARLLPGELKSLYKYAECCVLVRDGNTLLRRGDAFRDLYAVRTGSFKAYVNDPRGREQRLGFFKQGDIIGFDAIETGRHRANFVAMERSEVIAIPFDVLNRFMQQSPELLAEIMHRMASKFALP
ncbi:MAG TPA: cyclic nucleotide-binding domain-containing protein [Gammaproteobacteria bacterium]|nr:cyclic nucleotide-binding domain-containing protein [Gammaproteobacteria bacterium]